MRYDRPSPRVVVRGAQRKALTWAGIFASNAPAPASSLDEAVDLLQAIVERRISIDQARGVGRTLLRELGVIA